MIALPTLKAFWDDQPGYADAREATLTWYRYTVDADWASPADVKADFRNASVRRDGRVKEART